jgi:hypothetical protein
LGSLRCLSLSISLPDQRLDPGTTSGNQSELGRDEKRIGGYQQNDRQRAHHP